MRGFTLIELLIVIAIIAIIAGVAFVALNPGQRFADARDVSRTVDITAILSAIKIDQVDNGGPYLSAITSMTAGEVYMITDGVPGSPDCDVQNASCDTNVTAEAVPGDHCVDLSGLVTEGYVADVPESPNGVGSWTGDITGYTLERLATGIITVRACESENTTEISVSR